MKRSLIIISVIFFVVLMTAFFISDYSVLNIKDLLMTIKDNRTPEITILDNHEQYYNKWRCFSVADVEITEADVDYNGWHKVPSINVKIKNVIKSFDLDPDVTWNNDSIINEWKTLIKDQRSVCIFGAFLQKEENGNSLWYIQKIKTQKGYWDRLKIIPR
jgi:hypothetical protein